MVRNPKSGMAGQIQRVGIVGGGVAGLTAAYRLLQKGQRVHLFESSPYLGGLLRTFDVGNERLECFYHHLFTTDTAALDLIEELGLAEQLAWHESKVGLFYDERIYPFVTPLDLLKFSPLAPIDRIRLGLTGLYLRMQTNGGDYERVTAERWIRRFAGDRSYDVVWGPLLRGKFGDRAEQVSMMWLWNKIHLRFSSRQPGLHQRELLGYLSGSFALYVDALAQRIRKMGGTLDVRRPVDRVITDGERVVALHVGGDRPERVPVNAVLVTVASDIFRRIAPPLPTDYACCLMDVPYQDAMCLILALKQSLLPVYWLNINDRDIPFLAVVEHTNLIEKRQYGDRHIVYISHYLDKHSPLLEMKEEEVWKLYRPHISRINPRFGDDWLTERWLFRASNAQPVFTVQSAGERPHHRTPIPGLYLANMSQIYPQDRGQNYSILMGEGVAEMIANDLVNSQGRFV